MPKIKMYYARSVDGKKTIHFRGETLICNHPFLFEHISKLTNEKCKKPIIDMKNYEIIEVEMEYDNEKK